MPAAVAVRLPVPVGTAFAFLADPRNRPRWQSSLRRVELLDDGPPRVGMRWRDVTAAGVRPELVITRLEPDLVWAERGRWRGVTGELTLAFAAVSGGTEVRAEARVAGLGAWAPVARLAELVAPPFLRADLRSAGRLLAVP